MRRGCLLTAVLVGAVAVYAARLQAAEPTPDELRFFETNVRPVLVARCHRCHGAEKQEGGLRLDSRAGLTAGGESGPVVVPGKPEESRLVAAIGYANEEL